MASLATSSSNAVNTATSLFFDLGFDPYLWGQTRVERTTDNVFYMILWNTRLVIGGGGGGTVGVTIYESGVATIERSALLPIDRHAFQRDQKRLTRLQWDRNIKLS